MFENYIDKIIQLNRFEKEDILNKKFLLEKDEIINIYYAPHNEFVNKKAKIFVIGITPGWTQTQIAFKTANEGLVNNIEIIDILKKCKYNSRFSGSMRKNLIDMLDQIGLNKKFHLDSSSELFNEDNNLLHTTSLI